MTLLAVDQRTSSKRLASVWRYVSGRQWASLMRDTLKISLIWLDKLVRTLFEEAEEKTFLNIMFFGLVFIFIPLAASVNALRGGSDFLFKGYLVMLAVVAVLAVMSHVKRGNALIGFINTLLAVVAGAGLMLGAPLYTLAAFTDRILHENIAHAFLICLLVAPFYYVVSFSVMNFVEFFLGRDPTRERSSPVLFVRRFLAALPLAFVLVFLAILLGQTAVEQAAPVRTLQVFVVSLSFSALSLPVTMCALSPVLYRVGFWASLPALLNALVSAMGLAIALLYFSHLSSAGEVSMAESFNVLIGLNAGGDSISLGVDFWVMHLPFLPILGVLGIFLVAALAKVVGHVRGLAERPNLATAGLLAMVGVGFFVCSGLLV